MLIQEQNFFRVINLYQTHLLTQLQDVSLMSS